MTDILSSAGRWLSYIHDCCLTECAPSSIPLHSLFFPFPRFRPISVFREADEDESGFMCCAFSARERFLMLGTCTGQLKLYNVFTGQEEASYSCHSSAITHLEPSRVCRGNYLNINNCMQCFAFVAECSLTGPLTCTIFKVNPLLKMCYFT